MRGQGKRAAMKRDRCRQDIHACLDRGPLMTAGRKLQIRGASGESKALNGIFLVNHKRVFSKAPLASHRHHHRQNSSVHPLHQVRTNHKRNSTPTHHTFSIDFPKAHSTPTINKPMSPCVSDVPLHLMR
ncbi:hypothetical protein CEXT_101491 [Caerostris extrusa]|uniref:Uncharacterized protein n=1 Tax=Caerostris extrusa TaxID=172846 RepID=A0AAV4V9Y0_CAEEX|nr:hypothetical protein CEXT_101491 [Caerostris extrusa]